ncbi:MAG: PIG-L family deacetylase, partial [Candidatus Marinimicrobia bacterium]|nr:PIG-L family deacetylase [Candidatus Neomarinimicrobiota bacterium]
YTLLNYPNLIAPEDWNGWLYLRGYNIVSGSSLEDAQLPVKVKRWGTPLIISLRDGKGKRTYVDLALGHQWMNIHPGAFRLLANLISY